MQRRRADSAGHGKEHADAVLTTALDGVITIDGDGSILAMNPAAERVFGYTEPMVLGRRLDDVMIPPELREAHRIGLERYLATGKGPILGRRVEMMALHISGRQFPVELSVMANPRGGRPRFTAHIRDLTEQRHHQMTARRANEARDELGALISHEVRSPIAAILADAGVLERLLGDASDEIARPLKGIQQSAERLSRVTGNMLALGKTNAAELEPEPVLLQRLLPTVVQRFSDLHGGRAVSLDTPDDLPPVLGMPTFIEQVVENLLTNAHKYGPGDRPIHVSARANGPVADVLVRDEGDGMRRGELLKLFEPFFRSERTSGGIAGIGLGLTVCKQLVHAMSGRIWVEAPEEGGTIFAFSLRMVPDAD
jgi:PAS domain S-box-containing protein